MYEAMDNAVKSEYLAKGEKLYGTSNYYIAGNLINKVPELVDYEPEDLVPLIQDWWAKL